ncbi:MAG: hypothetical protein COT74_09815 [Bdellovibrionales bacterium CG10_big_fil_rev_8_21_14_0_10_45_34]|nr:MAG: hypothetical protein COT74_09815 [Bdellovibrionales bacterium CG10_big_fil_rev_8_21_14_0_10_45_34]
MNPVIDPVDDPINGPVADTAIDFFVEPAIDLVVDLVIDPVDEPVTRPLLKSPCLVSLRRHVPVYLARSVKCFRKSANLLLCITLLVCFYSLRARTQVSLTDQSPASIDWKFIETDSVKIVYPSRLRKKAAQIAELIGHYSQYVGRSYDQQKPRKFTLILRPEMASPNGFVTRSPFRSEWYSSTTINPFIGGLDWYQALSIHEYRHVVQLDYFDQGLASTLNYLFGDTGLDLAQVFALQPWFHEGDAVWAETKYSDAGRGRSPRFLARLKALMLAGETPSYDQFISGTYSNELVNHYVFGYILVSQGYKKFGADFWKSVLERSADFPYPTRITQAFERVSGQDFFDFYEETFNDLKQVWSKDRFSNLEPTEFSEKMNPQYAGGSLYFVEKDLNSFSAIFRMTKKGKEKIRDIPYSDMFSRLDFRGSHAIFVEQLPHWRYGFKSFSDLVLVDLKERSLKYITSGERLYNPHFNISGDRIVASEFFDEAHSKIQEFEISGERARALAIPGLDLIEAVPTSENRVVVIAVDRWGFKSIILAEFGNQNFRTLIPKTRNNIFWLQHSAGAVLFEAQYKGYSEVFKLDIKSNTVFRCTHSKIASYAPAFANNSFVFSEQTPYGSRLKKRPLADCKKIELGDLTDYNYLSDQPSDNYNNFETNRSYDLVNFSQNTLETQNKENSKNSDFEKSADTTTQFNEGDYGSFDSRAFIPHSWGFFVGNGFGLSLLTDNYLGDFGSEIALGSSAEENQPFASAKFNFKKYWPIFSLVGEARKRSTDEMRSEAEVSWREFYYGLDITLPYVFQNHLYSGEFELNYSIGETLTDELSLSGLSLGSRSDTKYLRQTIGGAFSYAKSLTPRSLISPLSLEASMTYEDVQAQQLELGRPGSYRIFGKKTITLPGPFLNDGFKMEFSGQKTREGAGNYQFLPPQLNPLSYVLSRGYTYQENEQFVKASGNYVFSLWYPDINLGAWFYTNRIFMNLYYDHTQLKALLKNSTLNSAGGELEFESKILRFLPINLGIRYIHRFEDSAEGGEMYLATQIDLD